MAKKVLYKRSSDIDGESPKVPAAGQLEYGEIAINYAAGAETLAIRNSNGEVQTMSLRGGVQSVSGEIESHVSDMGNPHEVTKEQIGLGLVENTPDSEKPVTPLMEEALSVKMDVSDIYNSTEESDTIDLTTVPWAASQGYSFKNVLDAYEGQDTSELEKRIAWCEENV